MWSDSTPYYIYRWTLEAHNVFGFMSLVSFWITMFVMKGGPQHKKFGYVYFISMLGLSLTVVFSSLFSLFYRQQIHEYTERSMQLNFSLYLIQIGFITLADITTAVLYVKHKNNLKASLNVINMVPRVFSLGTSAIILYYAVTTNDHFFLFMGLFLGIIFNARFVFEMIRIFRGRINQHTYVFLHLRAMISSGTALHIAFFTGGATYRYWPSLYEYIGNMFLILPIPIAVLVDYILLKKYNEKYIEKHFMLQKTHSL